MNKHSLRRYRAHWQQLNGRGQVFLQGLAPRERHLLLGTGVILGSWLIGLLLIQPPLQKIDYWQAETPKLRSQAETLEGLFRQVGLPTAGQSIEQTLRQTLDAAGLAGRYQLQAADPTAAHAWQLTFEQAPAPALLGWLMGHAGPAALEVIEARLERSDGPDAQPADAGGTLSGTVRLDQAPAARAVS